MKTVYQESVALTLCFFLFILLSGFTVMNMLIGIVCEVIAEVKRHEEEEADNFYLRNNLLDILDCYDKDGDECIGKEEFDLLMTNPEVLDTLQRFGTDADGLTTMAEVIFDADTFSGLGKLSFEELIEVMLRLKGQNGAKVTDVVEVRKFMMQHFKELHNQMRSGFQTINEKIDNSVYVTAQAMIDVRITLAGHQETKVQRHLKALQIGDLLHQLEEKHGKLVATDGFDVEFGRELTLGDIAIRGRIDDRSSEDMMVQVHLKKDIW
jgi:hypothetical protein